MSLSSLIVPPWLKAFWAFLKTVWPLLLVAIIVLSGWYMLHRIDSLKTENTQLNTSVSSLQEKINLLVVEQKRLGELVQKNVQKKAEIDRNVQNTIKRVQEIPESPTLDDPLPVDGCVLYPELCQAKPSDRGTQESPRTNG